MACALGALYVLSSDAVSGGLSTQGMHNPLSVMMQRKALMI